jgi:hypothetical protein
LTVAREWGVALALGLVVAAGLWAIPGDGPEDAGGDETTAPSASSSTTGPGPALLTPFEWGTAIDQATLDFLLVAPRGRAPAEAELNQSGLSFAQALAWRTPNLAVYETQVSACPQAPPGQAVSCDPAWAFGPWPLPKATGLPNGTRPLLGIDGYNATRATIYVFNEQGLLAATNDAQENWTRFAGSPTTMDPAVWYIGANATAPNGTSKPPSFAAPLVQKLRPLIEGLPVGGVATTSSNAYVGLYGTLFITARIDELVYAP